MARYGSKNKYTVDFKKLKEELNKKNVPNNILLFTNEKVVIDEAVKIISKNFLKSEPTSGNVLNFYSDDKNMEALINECTNFNFFSEKKIITLKVSKRAGTRGGFTKDEKLKLINYFGNYNPDIVLIIVVIDNEIEVDTYSDFFDKVKVFYLNAENENDIISFIKDNLEGYEIDDATINHFLSYLNLAYDEIFSEIKKLKIYCTENKKITIDDIDACIGFSKNYTMDNLVDAIFMRDFGKSIHIYNRTATSDEFIMRLMGYIIGTFTSIAKLFDPDWKKWSDFETKRELKLWNNPEKQLKYLLEYKSKINELKLKEAFDYIYEADKALKSTGLDKNTVMTALIYQIINL